MPTAKCPKCGNKIPARKLLSLSRFRPSIICPMCSSKLEWKNKGTGSLIGGIGGGIGGGLGALLGGSLAETGDTIYLILVAPLLVGLFFASWGAVARFAKFETKIILPSPEF